MTPTFEISSRALSINRRPRLASRPRRRTRQRRLAYPSGFRNEAGWLFARTSSIHTSRYTGHGDFYSELINLLGSELKGSKDFTKLCTGLSILGYISSQLDKTSTEAFSQLLTFLGHRYPKIRKAAADQVYLVLLQNDNLLSAENMDKAQEVLAETCWEGDVAEARRKRSELNEMAGFGVATLQKSENQQETRTEVRNAVSTDENTSYSSLVEFTGY